MCLGTLCEVHKASRYSHDVGYEMSFSRRGVCSCSLFHEDLPLACLPLHYVWITLQVLINGGLNDALHSTHASLRVTVARLAQRPRQWHRLHALEALLPQYVLTSDTTAASLFCHPQGQATVHPHSAGWKRFLCCRPCTGAQHPPRAELPRSAARAQRRG